MGYTQGHGAPNGWNPKSLELERDPRRAAVQAESWCTAARHQQRALGPQSFQVGGSQLRARCEKLDHGRLELSPSPCRPTGEGRGKRGCQGANVVAESPRCCPAGSGTVLHCGGRSVGTSRPEGAPCSGSQKSAVPAGSAGQNPVHPAGRRARRDPRGCLRREREPALRALSSCVLRHTHTHPELFLRSRRKKLRQRRTEHRYSLERKSWA